MALLNRRTLMIAIPCWIALGAFIIFVPVQNIINLQEHKYDCRSNAEFLQLENGTLIPCKNHSLSDMLSGININNTSFNSTKP
jgi:hypothetical protein